MYDTLCLRYIHELFCKTTRSTAPPPPSSCGGGCVGGHPPRPPSFGVVLGVGGVGSAFVGKSRGWVSPSPLSPPRASPVVVALWVRAAPGVGSNIVEHVKIVGKVSYMFFDL